MIREIETQGHIRDAPVLRTIKQGGRKMTEEERAAVAKEFGKRLRELRKDRKMQQREVAEKLGIRSSAVCNWETGLSYPTFQTMLDLCSLFNIDAGYFFGSAEETRQYPLSTRRHMELWNQLLENEKDTVNKGISLLIENRQRQYLRECRENFRRLPLSSLKVCAGSGSYLEENGNGEYLYLRRCEEVNRADEVITVTGRSMEPTFRNGDLLLVKHQENVSEGEIGIFVINGEGMVKEFRNSALWPHNPAFRPIIPDSYQDVRCYGLVLGIVKDTMLADDEENRLLINADAAIRKKTLFGQF